MNQVVSETRKNAAPGSLYEVAHWIGGRLERGNSTRHADIYNPALGVPQGRLILGTETDLDNAVSSAAAAFPAWAQTPPLTRARVLFRFLEIAQTRRVELAECLVREHGKTLPDALGEVARGIEMVEFATGIPQLLNGYFSLHIV
jgi:malonate-semialdehyde dehydrogenase (acetylating)/methylmalonate-semialdehyde dehydrogenase